MPVQQATYNKRLLEILREIVKRLPQDDPMVPRLGRELEELQNDLWKMKWETQ